MVIYKYPLQVQSCQWLNVPSDFSPLSVQEQHGQICLWAVVTPEAPTTTMMLFMRGTGHPIEPIPPNAQFIGTVQQQGGALVWHVFVAPYQA